MEKFKRNCCGKEAALFKALGHPTRLWIVRQLAGGEHCVCEFVDAVGVKFATVSRHLAILKEAGVLTDEKRGKQVFYRLKCPCILDVLDCVAKRK